MEHPGIGAVVDLDCEQWAVPFRYVTVRLHVPVAKIRQGSKGVRRLLDGIPGRRAASKQGARNRDARPSGDGDRKQIRYDSLVHDCPFLAAASVDRADGIRGLRWVAELPSCTCRAGLH